MALEVEQCKRSLTVRSRAALIVQHAGNQILARLYDQLRDRQLRMGVAVMQSQPDRVAKNITEHAEILDRIEAGDAEGAAHGVRQHLSWVKVLVRGEDR